MILNNSIFGSSVKTGKMYANNTRVVNSPNNNIWVHNENGLKYSSRVRKRGVEDPRSHNFPYSYDKEILKVDPIMKENGYRIYRKEGTMSGKIIRDEKGFQIQTHKEGVFEIGVTRDGIIDHRFFRPN